MAPEKDEKKEKSTKKSDEKIEKDTEKQNKAPSIKEEEKEVEGKDTQEGSKQDEAQKPLVQLTFYSYLIMLGALGWQFLGKIPNPQTGKVEKNLMQVKEIIDLLEILEEKTKSNLSKEEDNILKSTLSNLRLNYVEEIKK